MTQEYAQQQRVIGGRYAIFREIGRGGMGVVWLAEDRTIGRRVAIKELRLPDGIEQHERHIFEERVLREARTAGRLNDPAVVTVFDVVQEAGTTFIVMELIDAPTLSDVVRQGGPLSEAFTARIAEQLVSALDTAHRAGIVHRDVKPSNVMIDSNGRAKLTDFGIAQSTDDPRLTTSGTLIGSPTYMSPERLKGQEAVPASDLWALGATLFFAVEGYGPYDRQNTAASIQAIMNEVAFLTRCRGPLASLIMGLLNSAPEGRPTAPQVRALLSQATQQIPITGPTAATWVPQNTAQAGVNLPAKNRRGTAILAAVLAVVMLAAGWFGHSLLGSSGDGSTSAPGLRPTMTFGVGGNIPVFEIYLSARHSCLQQPPKDKDQFTSSDAMDCVKESHKAEVFAEIESAWFKKANKSAGTPAADYPGDALVKYAESGCTVKFASNQVTKKAAMNYLALIPSQAAWERADSPVRYIYCVAWNADGSDQTGSILAGED